MLFDSIVFQEIQSPLQAYHNIRIGVVDAFRGIMYQIDWIVHLVNQLIDLIGEGDNLIPLPGNSKVTRMAIFSSLSHLAVRDTLIFLLDLMATYGDVSSTLKHRCFPTRVVYRNFVINDITGF